MPTLQDPLTIVTDLDGSLLDHHTYGWEPAESWLARLQAQHIPLVICSSKTAAEIIPLQRALGISGAPFIAENGAVVRLDDTARPAPFLPGNKADYPVLCQRLAELRARHAFKFTGFADVSEKEVSEWTGLTEHDATLARMREASESIIWRDSAEQFALFRQQLEAQDLTLVQGGRFWHVMRQGSGKGAALRWLLQHSSLSDSATVTIGLGDGPNDAPMLDIVDYAVVIKGYSKNPVILQRQDKHNIYHTAHFGPEGWSEGLTYFITQ
ncbi:mannosyl-3-phosphoglycerate phosphatase-related protein [Erwinia sorbitola]|uniref:Mannosyl-3-phosphoglycerate phosphatase-related protein n=1 Tax=Erwinia sorbitola TaxID=2681984 RepID=A0ABW9R983_9GAMM|nr:mannosyl-3-phosphoglycerate phosphatase-related protein [Erwinia sorbitola]MTD25436.1 mannosyl-3-phosphoglycerate phosphatase-related protein [Erwinia sorbitola]